MADTPSFSPLYRQIQALLTRSLDQREWKPGEAIPSEAELAQRFKVSQGTVRKAVDALAADNLLVRRQGKGTFVASHAEAQTQYRFLRLTADEPAQDGGGLRLQRRLLSCERRIASAEVARLLALKSGDSVLRVRRLLLAAGQPVVLDDLVLPGARFRGLTAERLLGFKGPMYRQFEAEFGVHMTRAEEKIRAVAADADTSTLLEVPISAPLLLVERLAYAYDPRPVEWRRGWYRTEAYHYRNSLT
jgi:GntR family transcriptional regulator